MSIRLIERAAAHADRVAVVAGDGDHTYHDLLEGSARVAGQLLARPGSKLGERVAFLIPPSFQYPAIQWGIWRAGAIAVPLCLSHPEPELEYVIEDCQARTLVGSPEMLHRLKAIARRKGIELISSESLLSGPQCELPSVGPERPAMIVYTSGTTGGPKGVVTTHANIEAQITSLNEAWAWDSSDRVLLVLPLHHVHGIINVLGCALWAGGVCEMLPRFDTETVWNRFVESELTLFMAVPTIYARLAAAWEAADAEQQRQWSASCHRFRLMVSGSAALPAQLFEEWRVISGLTLLERYGMTEIGMALSNPLQGQRRPGYVGVPLPGVQVRRVDAAGEAFEDNAPAEIEVKSAGVFREYWRRPEETSRAFRDGWFRTGDVAVVEKGSYRILGRQSVDIIKTGGYKVSALEIEETLREHPEIAECAVVGLPDEEWGERVAAAVILTGSFDLNLDSLRAWTKERIAPYKAPSRLVVVSELPRNAMGKVTKPEVKRLFTRGQPTAKS